MDVDSSCSVLRGKLKHTLCIGMCKEHITKTVHA